MIKLLIILIFLIGCSGGGGDTPNGDPIAPQVSDSGSKAVGKCRHEALIACVIYEEAGYPCVIDYGPMLSGEYHVQAKAFINGQWEWLEVRNIFVRVGSKDDFEPEKQYDSYEIYENCVGGVWF